MMRGVIFALAMAFISAVPASARLSCISDLPIEITGCGIERGPNEPPAHCGSMSRGVGGGGSGWSERQGLPAKPEEKAFEARATTGVEPTTWGQVKHVLSSR